MTFVAAGVHAEPLRILCIGDSITQGGNTARPMELTYRLPLQAMLRTAGVPFDFIGTRHRGLDPDARWPAGFDDDHEGYYGMRTAVVRDRVERALPALAPPDVALVHLGTNDMDRPGAVARPLADIVAELRERNPRVVVLVGHVTLTGWRAMMMRWRVTQLTGLLDTPQSPVIAVNHHRGWRQDSDTFDGVHPNPWGQHKMAEAWFNAMRPFAERRVAWRAAPGDASARVE